MIRSQRTRSRSRRPPGGCSWYEATTSRPPMLPRFMTAPGPLESRDVGDLAWLLRFALAIVRCRASPRGQSRVVRGGAYRRSLLGESTRAAAPPLVGVGVTKQACARQRIRSRKPASECWSEARLSPNAGLAQWRAPSPICIGDVGATWLRRAGSRAAAFGARAHCCLTPRAVAAAAWLLSYPSSRGTGGRRADESGRKQEPRSPKACLVRLCAHPSPRGARGLFEPVAMPRSLVWRARRRRLASLVESRSRRSRTPRAHGAKRHGRPRVICWPRRFASAPLRSYRAGEHERCNDRERVRDAVASTGWVVSGSRAILTVWWSVMDAFVRL